MPDFTRRKIKNSAFNFKVLLVYPCMLKCSRYKPVTSSPLVVVLFSKTLTAREPYCQASLYTSASLGLLLEWFQTSKISNLPNKVCMWCGWGECANCFPNQVEAATDLEKLISWRCHTRSFVSAIFFLFCSRKGHLIGAGCLILPISKAISARYRCPYRA